MKILICAPSNNAANELAIRIIDSVPKTDLLRYLAISCNFNEIPEKLKPYCNYQQMNTEFYHPSMKDLLKFRIIVSTCVNAAR